MRLLVIAFSFCLLISSSAFADDIANALYASCAKGSHQPLSEQTKKACLCMAQKLATDQRLSDYTKQQLVADLRYDPSKDPARANDQTKIEGVKATAYETLAKTEDLFGCIEDKNGKSVQSQMDEQAKSAHWKSSGACSPEGSKTGQDHVLYQVCHNGQWMDLSPPENADVESQKALGARPLCTEGAKSGSGGYWTAICQSGKMAVLNPPIKNPDFIARQQSCSEGAQSGSDGYWTSICKNGQMISLDPPILISPNSTGAK